MPAYAGNGDELAGLINAYRAAPGACRGRHASPVATLALHPALQKVRIGPGTFVEQALEQAGYMAERAEAISLSGVADATSAMAAIQQTYCGTLLSTEFVNVGTARSGNDWLIVLAKPAPPPPGTTLPVWTQAGRLILEAVNAARAQPRACGTRQFGPAPALAWNAALGDAALVHSEDMAKQRYFSHQDKDGRVVGDRARRAGYGWRIIGENIASGQRSPEEAVEGWLSSPGHCANIMNPNFSEMGAAYAAVHDGRRGNVYWTQVLGTALVSGQPAPAGNRRAAAR